MTVQCEKCHTKYRLEDSKVTEQGVKVRCAKCKHIFVVSREVDSFAETPPPAAVPAADFNNLEATTAAQDSIKTTTAFTTEPEFEQAIAADDEALTDNTVFDFSDAMADFSTNDAVEEINIAAGVEDVTDTAVHDFHEGAAEFSTNGTTEETNIFAAADGDDTQSTVADFNETAAEIPANGTVEEVNVDIDFANFIAESSFAETALDNADNPFVTAEDTSKTFAEEVEPTGEITDSQDYGELSFLQVDDQEVYMAEPREQAEELIPSPVADLQPDEELFAAPFIEDEKPQQPKPSPSGPTAETTTASFAINGNRTADFAQVKAEPDTAKSEKSPFTPAQPAAGQATAQDQAETENFEFTSGKEENSQAPTPLGISSQRQKSPLFAILITIIGLLIFGALGYMAYVSLYDGKDFLAILSKPEQQVEEGKITVSDSNPVYLNSPIAGEMLVINGEAVNQFNKPRASLQIKASIFAQDGSLLTSKTVYAGNFLNEEQLLDMEPQQIEAAMANQFGDSLINLEVQPGKSIPFTIVIFNPPAEGQDFSVEAISSTVATTR